MASIRKMPNGKWQAQFRPVPGGRQITKTTRRKVDAQQLATGGGRRAGQRSAMTCGFMTYVTSTLPA